MQILSKLEALSFAFVRRGGQGKKEGEFSRTLRALKVGQSVLLTKAEFGNLKTEPAARCGGVAKRTGMKFSCRTIADKSGWVITRVA